MTGNRNSSNKRPLPNKKPLPDPPPKGGNRIRAIPILCTLLNNYTNVFKIKPISPFYLPLGENPLTYHPTFEYLCRYPLSLGEGWGEAFGAFPLIPTEINYDRHLLNGMISIIIDRYYVEYIAGILCQVIRRN
jgi:hypothetical protein